MDVKKTAEFCGKFRCESDISVQDDLVGDAIMWYHVTGVEERYSFRVNGFGAGKEYRGF
jgi:hypothetical protein